MNKELINQKIKTKNNQLYLFDGYAWRLAQKVICKECGVSWYIRADKKANDLCYRCRVLGSKNPMYGKRSPSYSPNSKGRKRKLWAIKYKGGKCQVCGSSDLIPACYHFHHVKKKTKGIGSLLYGKFKTLKDELDKCILLCANCHITLHYKGE